MDTFDQEIIKFLHELEQRNVAYILVGGFAVNLHGYNRFTPNLDIWINNTPENHSKLNDLERPGFFSTIFPLNVLTVVQGLEHLEFDECYHKALVVNIAGTNIPVLDLEQLILNRKAVNGPTERIDVISLERIFINNG